MSAKEQKAGLGGEGRAWRRMNKAAN